MNRACRPTIFAVLSVAALATVLAAGCATVAEDAGVPTNAAPTRVVDRVADPQARDVEAGAQPSFERLDAPAAREESGERLVGRDAYPLAEPDIYFDDSITRREPRVSASRPAFEEIASPPMPLPAEPIDASPSPAQRTRATTAADDDQPPAAATVPGERSAAGLAEPIVRETDETSREIDPGAPGVAVGTAATSAAVSEPEAADQSQRSAASIPSSRPSVSDPSETPEAAADGRAGREAPSPGGSGETSARSPAVAETGGSADRETPVRSTRAPTPLTPEEEADAQPSRADQPVADVDPTPRPSSAANDAEPAWNARTARVGADSDIELILPGRGWLYVGREYGDGEVTLLGKRTVEGDEAFRFRVAGPGSYGLWFQQQDAQTGRLVNERLGVEAVTGTTDSPVRVAELAVDGHDRASDAAPRTDPPSDGAAQSGERADSVEVGGERSAPPDDEPPATPSDDDRIAGLLSAGDASGALSAYAAAEQGRDELVAQLEEDELAALASAITTDTPLPVVRAFWRDVASTGSQLAPRARRELYEIALVADAPAEALRSVERLEQAREASAEDLLRVAALFESHDQGEDALPLYARALARASAGTAGERAVLTLADDRLFDLAQFLERVGPGRDLRAAARLYRLIVEERPLSPHWDASRSRLEHLRRHYFEVR